MTRGGEGRPLRIDVRAGQVWQNDRIVPLRAKTWAVLRHLIENPGVLVTRDELLSAVWGDVAVSDATLTQTIRELRIALGDGSSAPRLIETVRGRGFRWIGAAVATASAAKSSERVEKEFVVGRETELARLTQFFARALAGMRQMVFVTGEAGIGKTTLVESFAAKVAARELSAAKPVLVGRGSSLESVGGNEPYLPFLDSIRTLGSGSASVMVSAQLRRFAPSWAAQLPWLLSENERERVGALLQGGSRERMLRELGVFLREISALQPLLLVLEDLHWGDRATVELLGALAAQREPARLIVLVTYRPAEALAANHPIHTVARQLAGRGSAEHIALECLSSAAVEELVKLRFTTLPGAADLAGLVHQKTDGTPLFVRFYLDHLSESGTLRQTAQGWRLERDLASIEGDVPQSLRAMIEMALESLDRHDVELLEAASVVGVEACAHLLAAAAGVEEPTAVERSLDDLARRQLFLARGEATVWPDGSASQSFRFLHSLYARVLYDRIGAASRRALHQRIGERLERGYGKRAKEIAAHLAVHFEASGDRERASTHLGAAAEQAVERFAYEDAARLYSDALGLTSLPAHQVHLQLGLGDALFHSGATHRAHAAYRAAADLATSPADLGHAALGLSLRDLRSAPRGEAPDEAIGAIERALATLGEDDLRLRTRLLARLACLLLLIRGQAERRRSLADQALASARRLAEDFTLAAVLDDRHLALWMDGCPRERLAIADELVTIVCALDLDELEARARGWRIMDVLELGRPADAIEEIEKYGRRAEFLQQPRYLWGHANFSSCLALLRGDFAAAEVEAERAFGIGQALEGETSMIYFVLQMLAIRREQGRMHELLPQIESVRLAQPHTRIEWILPAIHLDAEDRPAARAALAAVAAGDFPGTALEEPYLAGLPRALMAADACAELGEAGPAVKLYDALLPYADRWVVILYGVACVGSIERVLGALAATCGRYETAFAHFERALEGHGGGTTPALLARTEIDYASALMSDGTAKSRARARKLLRQAAPTIAELGMSGLSRRAAALRA